MKDFSAREWINGRYFDLEDFDYGDAILTHASDYLDSNNQLNDMLYDMYEFDDMMQGKTPTEIVDAIDAQQFNTSDNYFYYDRLGWVCSTDDAESYYDDVIDEDHFMEYLEEAGVLDDYEIEEEEEEKTDDED